MFIHKTSANSNDVIYSVVIHGNQSVVIFLWLIQLIDYFLVGDYGLLALWIIISILH